jgi:hypothetical protein
MLGISGTWELEAGGLRVLDESKQSYEDPISKTKHKQEG